MKSSTIKSLNYFALLVLTGLALSGCKKPEQTNFYQSNGNFLILKVDEKLEAAYEFNLTNTTLVNDSLPLIYHTISNGINQNTVLQFTPNTDTLQMISSNNFTFFTNPIASENLQQLKNAISFDSAFFQVIGNATNVDLISIWSKIAKLDIVKTYRSTNPTAKMGIQKLNFSEYDPQLGFSVPNEKFMVFLVK